MIELYFLNDRINPNLRSYITILLCKDILKKGDIAIDIGANVGYFSAIFNQSVGKNGVVHSFEPNPEVSELLQENMKNFHS